MEIKKVIKHWGQELWIADGTHTPYACKRILFKAGKRTSLQVHEYKIETNYVLSGTGILLRSREPLDISNYLKNGMTSTELEKYESTFERIELKEDVVFHIAPGWVHRVIAITDLTFMETSTTELDDVIRLQDDEGRTHGRIDYEHI